MKKAPEVLTRMKLSCCWGDNLNEKELNDVVDYINELEQENKSLQSQLKQKEALIKKIENIFDDTNNSFSDGCDCRKIEKLLDNKGE